MSGYLLAAALCLLLGHVCKARRWKLLVQIYEPTPLTTLLKALSAGYMVNFYVPLHLGDVLRIWLAGRRMENGPGFAAATVIVDRVLDVLVMTGIFGVFCLLGGDAALTAAARRYLLMLAALLAFMALAACFSQSFKRLARAVCSIFNERIQYQLLFFAWSLISAFKALWKRVAKGRLLADTLLMWSAYLCSYFLLARFLTAFGQAMSFRDVLLLMFAPENLASSTFAVSFGLFDPVTEVLLCAYLWTPLVLLAGYGLLQGKKRGHTPPVQTAKLLPQLRTSERLSFLNSYFSGDSRQTVREYLEMNADVTILQDYSSGSDASTMLCVRNGETVFRKYAVGGAAEKLRVQEAWLERYAAELPLPRITAKRQSALSFCYDMQYAEEGVGMFRYVYAHPTRSSWDILHQVLQTLTEKLHRPTAFVPAQAAFDAFYQEKVEKNLQELRQSRALRALCAPEELTVNGVRVRNLPALAPMLQKSRLREVFAQDMGCEIHGDLTLENIICYTDGAHTPPYYLIDPNPGTAFRTNCMELAKLFQSLHGRYEFLDQGGVVTRENGSVEFLFPESRQYEALFSCLCAWIRQTYGEQGLRSVFYHEIIHWLRLMPYRLRRREVSAPRYYAAMLLVMNDVYDRYEEKNHEKKTGDL